MLSKEDLGKYLKELRNNRHLSLREVDNITGISYSHLNMIENGKRNVTPALLRVLSNLYRVDYLDLYEKAGYIDLIEHEKKDEFRYASDNGLDTTGLTPEEIEELKEFMYCFIKVSNTLFSK